jgi:DMSO/TMAO reductase YedYZ molybdopterin-dependent catalytic subunit
MKTKMLMALALVVVAAASVPAAPPEERLRVAVPGGASLDLGAAEIAALPHTEVRAVDSHGKGGLFRGVDLVELLHRAGAAAGDALRGSHLRDVRVECADGYVVAFTLAELDPAVGARRVLLADALDGNPLGAEQGPWRLVVPDDKRPARWARQVRKVAVVVLD